MHHPVFDLAHWLRTFPAETFERRDLPRRFPTSKDDDPVDLWKPVGHVISSPVHLCEVEHARRSVAMRHDLGRAIPTDTFVWRHGPPALPYLTRLGGVPHRERSAPWPKGRKGAPFTFVAQFCFLDSKDIVSQKLPGDVLLVFFADEFSPLGRSKDIHFEWSSVELQAAATCDDVPPAGFAVPELTSEIHRSNDYPDSDDLFRQAGHYQHFLIASTQATKIGRSTFFVQNDPRSKGRELLCTLSSVQTNDGVDGSESTEFLIGDLGCLYVMIDGAGAITWSGDCY